MTTDHLLTIPEVSQRLGIGRTTVRDLISTNALASVKIGRARRVSAVALDDYIAGLTTPEPLVDLGEVPVDSGRLLIVDPANLPDDLVATLTAPNAHGVTVAVIVHTPQGDGWYPLVGERGALAVLDPYYWSAPDGASREARAAWSAA